VVDAYGFVGWSTEPDALLPATTGWVFADDADGNPATLLNDTTGVRGAGTTSSPYTITLYADWAYTRVNDAPVIQDVVMPEAFYGQPFDVEVSAIDEDADTLNWTISEGYLPEGVSLTNVTGPTIHLTAESVKAAVGSYSFTLRCADAEDKADVAELTIEVKAVVPTLADVNVAAVVMGGAGSEYSAANAGPGVKLTLTAPEITSDGGATLLGQGWQCDVSGTWEAFDPDTYMSLSYNGKRLRYYATNSVGTGYSNEATIAVNPNSLYPVLGGKDRLATSRLTALDAWPEGSKDAVLAIGSDFKDALAASYLAGWLEAPVLLVSATTKNNAPIKEALKTLKVSKVYTVGAAVTDTIRKSVWTGTTVKVSPKGKDGVTEAIDIVKYVTGTLKKAKPTSVLITTTSGFADAMGTAAYAANPKLNMPILYVNGKNDASKASAYVKSLGSVKTTYVLGSTVSVSAAAAKKFSNVKRVYGADRNLTAAAAFETFSPMVAKANKDGHLHSVGIAAGSDFADALGAGAAQAHLGGAVMITPPTKIGEDVKAVLDGGTFKSGVTTYKAPAIQKDLIDFCFYGLTMSDSIKKSISGYIR
jgi:putative cell wall-binding protein